MVVEGIYEMGTVTLKHKVNIPEKTEVLVVINERKNRKNFLKSAGSWKGVDEGVFDAILSARKDKRERGFQF
jgi:predicted DNA-binding antitoxin AbrB/MazE fold protein